MQSDQSSMCAQCVTKDPIIAFFMQAAKTDQTELIPQD